MASPARLTGTLLLAFAFVASAGAAPRLSITVRVYLQNGDHATLGVATSAADRALAPAGLGIAWTDCPASAACAEPARPHDLILRVVQRPPAGPAPKAFTMGFAVVDPSDGSGTLATVFADRVARLAEASGEDARILLGYAMAHEIAHLLLGTTEHDRQGLMRAHWTAGEVHAPRAGDWCLSRRSAARIRDNVVRRTLRADLRSPDPRPAV